MNSETRHLPVTVATILVAASLLLGVAICSAPARADVVIGGAGSGVGQYRSPRGVAYDTANGRVYVSDAGNFRVDVFSADGSFVEAFGWGVATGAAELQKCTAMSSCQSGIEGAGSGQFGEHLMNVAVDNDPLSLSYGDVYIADTDNNRVQKFGPEGEFILMLGGGVDVTTGGNLCTEASTDTCGVGDALNGKGHFPETRGIAVGADGMVYVVANDELVKEKVQVGEHFVNEYARRIQEFSPAGLETGEVVPTEGGLGHTTAITVDSAGNIYIGSDNVAGAVAKYDPSGKLLLSLDSPSSNINALTVDAADDVFVADNSGNASAILEYSAAGTEVSAIYGTLTQRVIGLAQAHTSNGDIFAVEEIPTESGNLLLDIPFPAAGPVMPDAPAFTHVEPVGNISATLNSIVNPEDKATTYHFQYVDQANFASDGFSSPAVKSTAESPSVGSDFELHPATAQLTGLTPDTIYHFRLVATNSEGSNFGPEEVFETRPALEILSQWTTGVGVDSAVLHASVDPIGIAATGYFQYVDDASYQESGFSDATTIPDVPGGASAIDFGEGEAEKLGSAQLYPLTPGTTYHYRVVVSDRFGTFTGPDRSFATFVHVAADKCPNQALRAGASAGLPDCRAYEMTTPVDKDNGDIVTLFDVTGDIAGLNQGSSDGEKLTYSSYRAFGDATSSSYTSQYLTTRVEGKGWDSHSISPPQEGPSLTKVNGLTNEFKAFSPDLSSAWLMPEVEPVLAEGAIAGFANLYKRSDLTEAYGALTTAKPPHTPAHEYVIELSGVSRDGRCAIFDANDKLTSKASIAGLRQLYESCEGVISLVSVLPGAAGVSNRATAGTVAGGGGGEDHDMNVQGAISEDGSRVYWTDSESAGGHIYVRVDGGETVKVSETVSSGFANFWAASRDGEKALFTTDAGPSSDELYEFDLATGTSTLITHAAVGGPVGVSEDLSYVYFVSQEALAAGAVEGVNNLYSDHEGTIALVAALSGADVNASNQIESNTALGPHVRVARVSPDGRHLAFFSTSSLTGYDNHDAVTGEADAEVFLYDAETGDVTCVSCNPSGARPEGRDLPGINGTVIPIAAELPAWENQLYAPRALSDDGGRVFFDSYDALLPADTNGREDVYEWEAPGVGTCSTESTSYFVASHGCLSLISSGESSDDSEFVDASNTGNDVFFATTASLVPQDFGLIDIYDARVDGGFPQAPPQPAACEGEACEASPSPPSDATPSSSTFAGAGDIVAPPVSQVVSKAKAPTRAQKLARALKACHSRHGRRRTTCEAQARKRFGGQAKRSVKTPAKGKGSSRRRK